MKLYHVTGTQFERFDPRYLNSSSEERCVSDEMETVSRFGFCFVREEDLDTLFDIYGDDFGDHIVEVELDDDYDENFTSDYYDFVNWIERDGVETVRQQLEDDGIDFLELYNGDFYEIIPLNLDNIQITCWKR